MASTKTSKFLLLSLASAFLGTLLISLFATRLITWYAEPAVDMGFNCASTAHWAMQSLLKWQIGGAIGGMLVGLLLVLWLSRRDRQKNVGL